jgi:phosphate-selective porin OprO/OprP
VIHFRRNALRARHLLSLAILTATSAGSLAFAQVPGQGPFDAKPAAPAVPAPALPPAVQAPVGTAREVELETRLRQMEAMVDKLSKQVDQLSTTGTPSGAGGVAGPDRGPGSGGVGTPSAMGGNSAPGQSLPPNPPAGPRFQRPATLDNKPAKAKFGPGFEIRSDDDEYIMQFHNLTQIDYRGYQQGGQNPVHDTFALPRQWFMFSGRLTQPIGYFVSIANGFDTLSALDVFLDFSYTPKFQVRVGRMKTPFTYEFLVEPIQ